ncbi:MAG: chemotaxis protein CheX [Bacteriovoracaceae bacterium]|nr:chemotaxis protein CheX [Bacteriovoracaceae bacterium]
MSIKESTRFLDFSKPFIDATKKVFETMVFTTLECGKPALKEGVSPYGDVTVLMGLNGKVKIDSMELPFRGMMVISFPMPTYLKIASAMLMGEYTSYSKEIGDVGAEISNIVTGNAKRTLRTLGYMIDMCIPSTVEGKDYKISYPEQTKIVMIPIKCNHGEFFMELTYQDSNLKEI